jgi:lipid-A-disaccharide synthase-like uncharacterized protein
LSLCGSVLLSAYAVERGVWVLLVGFAVNGCIYLRNLALRGAQDEPRLPRAHAVAFALGSVLTLTAAGVVSARVEGAESLVWLAVAVVGQAIWSSRFVVQWWYSELSRRCSGSLRGEAGARIVSVGQDRDTGEAVIRLKRYARWHPV